MTDTEAAIDTKKRSAPSLRKRLWVKVRTPLVRSRFAMASLSRLVVAYFRLVHRTNPQVEFDARGAERLLAEHGPIITTCWHGQHFLIPMFRRNGEPSVAMVSRSKDAELNAQVIERMGVRTIRASGGRGGYRAGKKGAVGGILAMRKELRAGHSVFMIADIPNGTPRKAGMGIVSISRLSGAPIVPVAYASSRRRVFERAWDKAVLNLPFGRSAFYFGDPIYVPEDADDETMENRRLELETSLDTILAKAYSTVDAAA